MAGDATGDTTRTSQTPPERPRPSPHKSVQNRTQSNAIEHPNLNKTEHPKRQNPRKHRRSASPHAKINFSLNTPKPNNPLVDVSRVTLRLRVTPIGR